MNNATKTAAFYFTRTGTITSEISYANAIPSGYRPYSFVRMKAHSGATTQQHISIESDGTVRLTGNTSTSITVSAWIIYAYF